MKKTKDELIRSVATETGLKIRTVATCVDSFLFTIGSSLEEGYQVDLRNFGKFERRKTERKNCFLMEERTVIPARWRVKFSPSKNLLKEWEIEDGPS